MNLGENIYKFRTQMNMSQGDLADALEVSRQSVSKWENNAAVPELEKLMNMAQLFGIGLEQLVTGETAEAADPTAAPVPPVPVPQTPQERLSAKKVIGIICLSSGLLCAIVCSILAILLRNRAESFMGLAGVMGLPLVIVGVILLLPGKNVIYWACTALSLILDFLVITTYGFGPQGMLISLLLMAPSLLMLVWTCVKLRRGSVHPGAGGTVLLLLAAFLLVAGISLTPPRVSTPLAPDASTGAVVPTLDFAQFFPISLL